MYFWLGRSSDGFDFLRGFHPDEEWTAGHDYVPSRHRFLFTVPAQQVAATLGVPNPSRIDSHTALWVRTPKAGMVFFYVVSGSKYTCVMEAPERRTWLDHAVLAAKRKLGLIPEVKA